MPLFIALFASLFASTPLAIRNIGAILSANLWRIATSFLLQVLIVRTLGLSELGYYTIALTYLNIGQILSEVGLPKFLIREIAKKNHSSAYGSSNETTRLFQTALQIQIGASLLIWALLLLLTFILPLPSTMRSIFWLVGATLPFYAITSAAQMLFQASERMALVMQVELLINTLIAGISLLILWMGGTVIQLIGVWVLTQAISAICCLWLILRNLTQFGMIREEFLGCLKFWQRPKLALAYKARSFYGQALTDVLLQRADIVLLSIISEPSVVGLYSAAYNIVRVLLKLIQGYWQALYPTFSRVRTQEFSRYQRLTHRSLRYGLIILFTFALLGSVGSAQLLRLVYGNEIDQQLTVLLQILLWIVPLFFVEIYAVTWLMVEGRPAQSLWITMIHLVTLLLLMPTLTLSYQVVGAAWAALIATSVGMAMGCWRIMNHELLTNKN